MTCIIGLVHGGHVTMGADSAITFGSNKAGVTTESKIWWAGRRMLIGAAGDGRFCNVVHHMFKPPPNRRRNPMAYMVNDFPAALRTCLAGGLQSLM